MKILSVKQIRDADAYTIRHEPIASIDLMERASHAFVHWFHENFETKNFKIKIFCGLGDNGGDGLAIARMLRYFMYKIEVFVVNYAENSSENFKINKARLEKDYYIQTIDSEAFILNFKENDIIIDALLGSGISRPIAGLLKSVVEQLNLSKNHIISIDVPSGLLADKPNKATDTIIRATQTVSFQTPKLAFMLPQNADFVGDFRTVDIGLNQYFIQTSQSNFFFSTSKEVEKLIKPRKKFSHKGTFGHGLLVAGSYGMMGAAVLSARACMRSGVGKLTVHSIPFGLQIMQMLLPEAMYWEAWGGKTEAFVTTPFNKDDIAGNFQAVGIGPGLGIHAKIRESIVKLCGICTEANIPMVLDADALNNFSTGKSRDFMSEIPKNSILTPHPKEFQKLINKTWKDDYEKLDFLTQFAVSQQVIVCLKGANTAIALPDGTVHFNSTGNAGMAKAGSGDVLTGMILALLAQGYTPQEAAILGVYQHGLAGDRVAQSRGMTSMIASDMIENIRF